MNLKILCLLFILLPATLTNNVYPEDKLQSISIINIFEEYRVLEEHAIPGKYSPANMFDNDLNTCFAEGNRDGYFTITIGFFDYIELDEIKILGGLQKNDETYYNNNRPKEVIIWLADNVEDYIKNDKDFYNKRFKLDDLMNYQSIPFDKSYKLKCIVIQGLGVYQGKKYQDTCITELKFFSKGKELPVRDVDKLKKDYVRWVGDRLKDFFTKSKYEVYSTERIGKATITNTGNVSYYFYPSDTSGNPPLPTKVLIKDCKLFMTLNEKTGIVDYTLNKVNNKRLLIDAIGSYGYSNGPIFEPMISN